MWVSSGKCLAVIADMLLEEKFVSFPIAAIVA